MVFSYYKRLSRKQQAVYRVSDKISEVLLPNPYPLRPLVDQIAAALKAEDRPRTEAACQALVAGIAASLKVPQVEVKVLAVRPSNDRGELHGFYRTPAEGARGYISVWMRTAQRRQVVAFRTFLRTLLHEVCHHLDFNLLRLPDSYHTEGFYKRETSLFRQLVAAAEIRAQNRGNISAD